MGDPSARSLRSLGRDDRIKGDVSSHCHSDRAPSSHFHSDRTPSSHCHSDRAERVEESHRPSRHLLRLRRGHSSSARFRVVLLRRGITEEKTGVKGKPSVVVRPLTPLSSPALEDSLTTRSRSRHLGPPPTSKPSTSPSRRPERPSISSTGFER